MKIEESIKEIRKDIGTYFLYIMKQKDRIGKSLLKTRKQNAYEEYIKSPSPSSICSVVKEEFREKEVAVQAIISIKKIETERDRKEKNKQAAKRSREKKKTSIWRSWRKSLVLK